MQKHLLFKTFHSVQLAHLYEHIFCSEVNRLFYKQGLFRYIDYSLVGKTYYGGVVCIDLVTYTQQASDAFDRIIDIPIDFNENVIMTAFTQMIAEIEKPIATTGLENVRNALNIIHQQPWQRFENLDQINVKTIRKHPYPVYIAKGKVLPSRKLNIIFSIDDSYIKNNRELIPLFRQLSNFIGVNIENNICDSFGLFNDNYIFNIKNISYKMVLKVAHSNDEYIDLSAISSMIKNEIDYINKNNGFDRLVADLTGDDIYNLDLAPNLELMYEDILIFMGPKGWKKIATKNNLMKIMSNMYIEIKFGKRHLKLLPNKLS